MGGWLSGHGLRELSAGTALPSPDDCTPDASPRRRKPWGGGPRTACPQKAACRRREACSRATAFDPRTDGPHEQAAVDLRTHVRRVRAGADPRTGDPRARAGADPRTGGLGPGAADPRTGAWARRAPSSNGRPRGGAVTTDLGPSLALRRAPSGAIAADPADGIAQWLPKCRQHKRDSSGKSRWCTTMAPRAANATPATQHATNGARRPVLFPERNAERHPSSALDRREHRRRDHAAAVTKTVSTEARLDLRSCERASSRLRSGSAEIADTSRGSAPAGSPGKHARERALGKPSTLSALLGCARMFLHFLPTGRTSLARQRGWRRRGPVWTL